MAKLDRMLVGLTTMNNHLDRHDRWITCTEKF
jgi:hypothetical protein